MDTIVTSVINAIAPMTGDAVLVLDDYHLIATPAIHPAMTLLLDRLPAHLHLVIISRADPPLPLTRLRTRRELAELRAADLRFTADEAAAFLTELMGLPLSADDVAGLEACTEGWIAGLQLAALAMRDLRASAWHERNSFLPEAIQHALAGQDWERAADLIEQCAWPITFRGQIHKEWSLVLDRQRCQSGAPARSVVRADGLVRGVSRRRVPAPIWSGKTRPSRCPRSTFTTRLTICATRTISSWRRSPATILST
jgi:ATP/maltotriose-dependent transcriptional regulator MalT